MLQTYLPAAKGKGMELTGTFSRRNQQIYMELTFANRAMQNLSGFAIQLNKNRFVNACPPRSTHRFVAYGIFVRRV